MTETRTIEIQVYRDKEGKPICRGCKLSIGKGFSIECNGVGYRVVVINDELKWDGIRPHTACPLWIK